MEFQLNIQFDGMEWNCSVFLVSFPSRLSLCLATFLNASFLKKKWILLIHFISPVLTINLSFLLNMLSFPSLHPALPFPCFSPTFFFFFFLSFLSPHFLFVSHFSSVLSPFHRPLSQTLSVSLPFIFFFIFFFLPSLHFRPFFGPSLPLEHDGNVSSFSVKLGQWGVWAVEVGKIPSRPCGNGM